MQTKRSRGRPRGSGKDDAPFLAQVADLLIKSAGLKPTTAMKRILHARKDWNGASDAAVLRRWQEKWKVSGETFLAKARERARAARTTPAGGGYSSGYSAIGSAYSAMEREMERWQRIQDMIDPPYLRALRQFEETQRRIDAAMKPFDQIGQAYKQLDAFDALTRASTFDITDHARKLLEQTDPFMRRGGY